MKSEWVRAFFKLMIVAMLLALLPGTSVAQEDGQLWTLITVRVYHDMTDEFEELQKELNAAYKKAGVATRLISQVVRGPSGEYFIAEPVDKWADYDDADIMAKALGEAGAARWVARITKCVQERRVDTYRSRPDLSIPAKDGRAAELAVVTTYRNLPGRYPDYNEWLVSTWMPNVKESGMDAYFTFRNAFGGSSREWTTYVLVDSWATFDTQHPVRQSVGDDAWAELMTTSGAMTTAPERKVIRLRPDLSIRSGN